MRLPTLKRTAAASKTAFVLTFIAGIAIMGFGVSQTDFPVIYAGTVVATLVPVALIALSVWAEWKARRIEQRREPEPMPCADTGDAALDTYMRPLHRQGLHWTLELIDEDIEEYGNPWEHHRVAVKLQQHARRCRRVPA